MDALPIPDTPRDDVYHLYALRFGSVPGRRVYDNFVVRDMPDGPMPLDFFIWIITNAHRTVVVDTGFGHRAAAERNYPIDVDPLDALSRLGLGPDAVEDVILTHLHFDHAGSIDRFTRARFHVQDADVAFATGSCMCDVFHRAPFDVEDAVALMRHLYAERLVFHDGDAAPFPGVTLHLLPGHSRGVQAVRVMTTRGPVLLASDVSHYYANFARMAPFRLTIDTVQTLRSYRRLMELAGDDVQRIIPGHDPKVRTFYPRVPVDGLDVFALHERPEPHDAAALKSLDDA